MRQVLAHQAQVAAFGGLSAKTRRALASALKEPATTRRRVAAGARLVREWNGRTHEVEVLAEGFLFRGKRFRSLSAIAREITGARWSGPRFFGVETVAMARVRCAIYTRKSSEDGLEQDFNSLDAQREACAAFIASQKAEGWVLLPDHYDDGGLSGGTLERPALSG